MSTTLNKLEYLDETKKEIKNALNTNFNSGITDEDTFRSYVTKINDIYTNWAKVTGEGTEITLNNTKKGKMTLTPKGNTEQTTYTGKNLLNLSSEYSVTGYKIINVNLGAGTYTISLESVNLGGNSNALMRFMNGENELTYFNVDTTHLSKTITVNDTINSIHIYSQDNYVHSQDVTSTFNKLMIEASSTVTDYEPYVGGTPSPNPDYPQDVRVVTGNNSVKVVGKNLFDKNNLNYIAGYLTVNGNKIESSIKTDTYYIECNPNTTYTLQREKVKTSGQVFRFASYSEVPTYNNQFTGIVGGLTDDLTLTITTGANDKYLAFSMGNVLHTDTEYIDKVQIEQGSSATTYEPYHNQTYPINLGIIELCKIGSYQDYIYKDSGKWYKHSEIGKVVLDGTQTISFENSQSTPTPRSVFRVRIPFNVPVSAYYSNRFIITSTTSNRIVIVINSDNPYISFDDEITNINESDTNTEKIQKFNTYVSNNNVVIYVPINATNTEITDTTLINQLNAIENAVSYDTQTNISSEYVENNAQMIISASALEKGGI